MIAVTWPLPKQRDSRSHDHRLGTAPQADRCPPVNDTPAILRSMSRQCLQLASFHEGESAGHLKKTALELALRAEVLERHLQLPGARLGQDRDSRRSA